MPQPTPAPVVGSLLPAIPLTAPDGSMTTLDAVRGAEKAVIFFLRASNCPICLAHSRQLVAIASSGALGGAQVILVVPGGAAEAAAVRRLITSEMVSVWASGDHHADLGLGKFLMLQHSGTFVVDEHGHVLSARTAVLPTAAFSRDEVVEALSAVRS